MNTEDQDESNAVLEQLRSDFRCSMQLEEVVPVFEMDGKPVTVEELGQELRSIANRLEFSCIRLGSTAYSCPGITLSRNEIRVAITDLLEWAEVLDPGGDPVSDPPPTNEL